MADRATDQNAFGEAFYAACLTERLWSTLVKRGFIDAGEAREELDGVLLLLEKWSTYSGPMLGEAASKHARTRLEGLLKTISKLAEKPGTETEDLD